MTAWAWATPALYVFWLLTAFGARGVIQRRRTGDSGFRGLSGAPGSVSWWAGVLFVVALLGAAAAPVAALTGLSALIGRVPAVHGVGTAVAALGVAYTLIAQQAMGASWRVGVDQQERTALVKDGPFARVRNPIFTAMALTSVGLALMVPNVVSLAALAALAVAVELQVRVVEEPYLWTTHGPAYAAYEATAGRFVPGIGRARPIRHDAGLQS